MGRWVQIILFYHGLPSMGLNSRTIPVGLSACRRLHTWARTPSGKSILTLPASVATLALKSPKAGVLLDLKGILTPSTWKSECLLWRPLSSLAASLTIIIIWPLLSMTMPFAYVVLIFYHHGNCRSSGAPHHQVPQNLVCRFPVSSSS